MFRPTHFVILFAVFLCAYAAPAAPESPAVEAPAKSLETSKQASPGAEDKSDLATDASTHLAYSYVPSWHTYAPGWAGKTLELGFLKKEIHAPLVFAKTVAYPTPLDLVYPAHLRLPYPGHFGRVILYR